MKLFPRLVLVFLSALIWVPAQSQLWERYHAPGTEWWVTDATGDSVDLLSDMSPGQILLAMPSPQAYTPLDQLGRIEQVLDVIGPGGTQELSMVLLETSGYDLTLGGWGASTSIPVFSSDNATLSSPPQSVGNGPSLWGWHTSIQALDNGGFIEVWHNWRYNPEGVGPAGVGPDGWWGVPLFGLLNMSGGFYDPDSGDASSLTLDAGFPDFDARWCEITGCEVESFESYSIGSKVAEENPTKWITWNGLSGTSQDGVVVSDPMDPENLVMEIRSDSINTDVALANPFMDVFDEYEIEFDLFRKDMKGAAFGGGLGQYGSPASLAPDIPYSDYISPIALQESGEASTFYYQSRGLNYDVVPEVWHHVRVNFFPERVAIEINGDLVWAHEGNWGFSPKLSAVYFWARPDVDTDFLVDNIHIKPVFRRTTEDVSMGCNNPNACNYNFSPTAAATGCSFPQPGTTCDGGCVVDNDGDGVCDDVVGCMDPDHPLFDAAATIDGGCCAVYQSVGSNFDATYPQMRPLKQSKWVYSRVVVTDSSESVVWYDSNWPGNELFDYEDDDTYLFHGVDEVDLLNDESWGTMVYDNNYVSNFVTDGAPTPEFGVYSDVGFQLESFVVDDSQLENGDYLCLDPVRRFSPDVEVDPNDFFFRETFFGFSDALGFGSTCYLIRTLNDSLLVVKSPVGTEGAYALLSFEAQPHDFPFCSLGCTDPNACNFQAGASYDDGSCSYFCESGCTDSEAQNFNPNAIVDNGSCSYLCGFTNGVVAENAIQNALEPGLLLTEASLPLGVDTSAYNLLVVPPNYTNSAGSAFPIASFTLSGVSGLPPGLALVDSPLNVSVSGSACLALSGTPTELGDYEVVFSGELVVLFGVLEQSFGTFDYSWTVTVEEGVGAIWGCTYPDAINFVSYATDDDGSCEFGPTPEPCPADLDNNGQVGTPDLLSFLSYFGALCE